MIRLVILALTGYLSYNVLQRVLPWFGRPQIPPQRPQPEVQADELVQDPVCKVFIPRRNALLAHKDGRDYFFCSEGCRKKFLRNN
ncbi:MAG: YHS domain-containing protein [Desulfobacca sp.]|uniref:YHS domain-containing protein n=1 Tax=Desulfobacca sp. TaxID=2067990 RepID=UPI004048EFA9